MGISPQPAATDSVACCLHGNAEAIAAFHRKFREGAVTRKELDTVIGEFENDSDAGAFHWLPLSPAVVARVVQVFLALPRGGYLRSADALHLACAAENGFTDVYSNDNHLLAAATHFGLKGINIV
jgi:predicted nucleic acid-binding protein